MYILWVVDEGKLDNVSDCCSSFAQDSSLCFVQGSIRCQIERSEISNFKCVWVTLQATFKYLTFLNGLRVWDL